MLKGEFIRGDGLVIPNNLTIFGAQAILAAAFQQTDFAVYMALVAGAPTPTLQMSALVEPAIGTHGYARQVLTRGVVKWPTSGLLNGQPYVESLPCVFAASGGAFTQAIRRMALVPSPTVLTGDIYSISSPLPADLTIDASTGVDDRTFRYRIYLG